LAQIVVFKQVTLDQTSGNSGAVHARDCLTKELGGFALVLLETDAVMPIHLFTLGVAISGGAPRKARLRNWWLRSRAGCTDRYRRAEDCRSTSTEAISVGIPWFPASGSF